MTQQMQNVLSALRQIMRGRRWAPVRLLDSYDGRTIRALVRRGAVEIDGEYGWRLR